MPCIMVVEDDKHTQQLMMAILAQDGYQTCLAEDGVAAMEQLDHQHVDLIVLDVMMPRMNGYQFTKELRTAGDFTPILMVTAKHLPRDMKTGFLAGTDDYMTKPVDEEEMLLRIKALLRRSRIVNEKRLIMGEVTLYYDSLTAERNGERQALPQKEFYLLYKLLSYPDKIFTRLQLMDEIWGMDSESSDVTVNVHINRLRKRFEDWPEFELQAVRGLGYKAVKKL